jgi:hypothetical protein
MLNDFISRNITIYNNHSFGLFVLISYDARILNKKSFFAIAFFTKKASDRPFLLKKGVRG